MSRCQNHIFCFYCCSSFWRSDALKTSLPGFALSVATHPHLGGWKASIWDSLVLRQLMTAAIGPIQMDIVINLVLNVIRIPALIMKTSNFASRRGQGCCEVGLEIFQGNHSSPLSSRDGDGVRSSLVSNPCRQAGNRE